MIQLSDATTNLNQAHTEKLIALGQSDPATSGKWDVWSNKSPISPIHAVLLPPNGNGKSRILFFNGSGNNPTRTPNGGIVVDYGNQNFSVLIASPQDANGVPLDLFCGGQSLLPDGSVLVAGGTDKYNNTVGNFYFYGLKDSFIFNRNTLAWKVVQPMFGGRWYPTQVTLGDGRVLAVSGYTESGGLNYLPEIYSPADDSWTVFEGTSPFPLYASLFLMENGAVFYAGAHFDFNQNVSPRILNLYKSTSWETPLFGNFGGLEQPDFGNQATSVLLPPAQDQRVMILGGGTRNTNTTATNRVNIVDLKANDLTYKPAPYLNNPRMHLSAVLLPDRTVFVCNGSKANEQTGQANTNIPAEIYDPLTNTWKQVATANVKTRVYHSLALLLPDGSVFTAGGNPQRLNECLDQGNTLEQCAGGDSPLSEELRVEVYSPPYLFQSQRPVINSASQTVTYGGTITIQTDQASKIQWVHLIKPMAITHSLDTEQRLVDLPINSRTDTALNVTVTGNPNLAPPGWYMLFITDTNRIPSVAQWVQLTQKTNTSLQATFYVDANFAGASQSFLPGVYRAARGDLDIVGNNTIRSLRVPVGLTVQICDNSDGSGLCSNFGPGDYPYVGDALNDITSYINVQLQSQV
ncbi:MAG: DUF1929 domain-containing protein [Stigonema ocellatum SAG 48.90 = DSM 106950]|nr:DUF1929 domain-containing protein [Stigonema ocellatum SAG 48.90 = DSM 106950]